MELVSLNTRFYWERMLVIGCQYVNKQFQDFRNYKKRDFRADFFSEESKNISKIPSCRFMQCLRSFKKLTVRKCSDTRLFRHLSNPAFCIISQTNNLWSSSLFSKYSKFYVDSGNAQENAKKNFRLRYNCIWIVCDNNWLLLKENTCIGCQYVNKNSQCFKYYWSRDFWADFLSKC